jgi:hypothetical protein
VLEESSFSTWATIVELILSLTTDSSVYYDAEPVLQHVGIQDMKRLREVRAVHVPVEPGEGGTARAST